MEEKLKKSEDAQKVNKAIMREMALRTRASIKLIKIVNDLLGLTPKSNKFISFEYHDRIKNEEP